MGDASKKRVKEKGASQGLSGGYLEDEDDTRKAQSPSPRLRPNTNLAAGRGRRRSRYTPTAILIWRNARESGCKRQRVEWILTPLAAAPAPAPLPRLLPAAGAARPARPAGC